MNKFLTIGEAMAVFSAGESDAALSDVRNWEMFTAGAELNVAIGVARLGVETDFLTALGNDPFGEFLERSAASQGIGTQHFQHSSEHPTGIYFKQRVTSGDPAVFYLRKGSAAANFNGAQLERIDFSQYKIAHLTGIFPAISQNALEVFRDLQSKLLAAGVFVTFDPNLRPSLWKSEAQMVSVLNELAASSALILPGVSEGKILCGTQVPEEIAQFYFDQSEITQFVVVKLGPAGALLCERGAAPVAIEGFKVSRVVDTVGAGDGFSAGLISALCEGASMQDAVRRAAAIGALAVTAAGDNTGYPTREELEKFMS